MKEKEIGSLLRICRLRKELTQEQLSRFLNIDQSVVSRIENGIERLDVELMLAWGDATDSRDLIAMMLTGRKDWQRMTMIDNVVAQMKVVIKMVETSA